MPRGGFFSHDVSVNARNKRNQMANDLRAVARVSKMSARTKKATVGLQPSVAQKVKALVEGKSKNATTVLRSGYTTLDGSNMCCLTSSNAFATAASGTGLIQAAGSDSALINFIRLKGIHTLPAVLDLDPSANKDTIIRFILVWFYKPEVNASTGGNLPLITDVLEGVAAASYDFPISGDFQAGRFKILSDRSWNLGTNTFQATTAVGHARITGTNSIPFDYTIKVNKQQSYAATATTTYPGGHFDGSVDAGQVSRGLPVLYRVHYLGNPAQTPYTDMNTRVNYTA